MTDSGQQQLAPRRPRRRRTMIEIGLTTVALALGAVFAAMALASGPATVGSASSATLGQRVLVNAKGRTLYVLTPETSRHLLCTSSECLKFWPPLTVPSRGTKLVRGAGVHGRLAILKRSERHAAGHAQRAAAVSLRRGPRERRSQRPELQRLRRHLARAGRRRRPELRRADGPAPAASSPTTSTTDDKPTRPHRRRPPRRRLRPATRTERLRRPPRGGPSTQAHGRAPGLSSSARRRSSDTACASTRCSCAERSSAIARASQPSRWRRSRRERLRDPARSARPGSAARRRGRRDARSGPRTRGLRSSVSSTAGARARRAPDRRSTWCLLDPGAPAPRPERARSDARRAGGASAGRGRCAARSQGEWCRQPHPRPARLYLGKGRETAQFPCII